MFSKTNEHIYEAQLGEVKQYNPYEKTGSEGFDAAIGDRVWHAQNALARLGYDIVTTGYHDDQTQSAIRKFQEQCGLTVDGKVSTQLMAALKDAFGTQKTVKPMGVTAHSDPLPNGDLPMPGRMPGVRHKFRT